MSNKPPTWTWDALGLLGCGVFGWGLWLVWPPATLLFVGGALLVAAVWGARRCS